MTGLVMGGVNDPETTVTADQYLCACDVPGIQKLLPKEWRQWSEFDNIYALDAVPVATVQMRFDGWVTELQDEAAMKDLDKPTGLDNLLYTADADFSCFADLAIASPADYYREGQGSLLQVVLTPGDPFIGKNNEEITEHVLKQVQIGRAHV